MPRQIDVDMLFETIVAVFAERGYQACTTQEIARRSGVNEATLYRRFGDKAALVNQALTRALTGSPFASLKITNDLVADLTLLVGAYADSVEQHGGAVLTLLTDVPRHPELREAMDVLTPNMRNAAQVIAAHQNQGHLSAGDPLRMVTTLLAPLMAAGLWHRAGYPALGSGEDPAHVVASFLEGHRLS
ncbi:TetR/AcrR family transcriptional regulator [Streptomyces sp. NPDC060030]|uniref:TetR/AcrR family transcriptional regulator n=1 Tax=Streptomyces sp. NPDC060030 TaxID=3347042 RepID=UPI003692F900